MVFAVYHTERDFINVKSGYPVRILIFCVTGSAVTVIQPQPDGYIHSIVRYAWDARICFGNTSRRCNGKNQSITLYEKRRLDAFDPVWDPLP